MTRFTGLLAMAALSAATAAPPLARFSAAEGGTAPAPWRIVTLPKVPRHTLFEVVELDGSRVLRVTANSSYGNLLHPVEREVGSTPLLRWRWRVDRQSQATDLTRKEGDDVPARLCVLFDVPLERLAAGDRWKLRLARGIFDPQLPAASICYVWDAHVQAGTWLPNAYTDRVQMIILRSAASGHAAGRWFEESRDLRADFMRAFPREASAGLPRVAAIGLAADGDNTGASSVAFFGDIVLDRTSQSP